MIQFTRSIVLFRRTVQAYEKCRSIRNFSLLGLSASVKLPLPSPSASKEEWERFRSSLFRSKVLNVRNDAVVLEWLLNNHDINTVFRYYKFLKESNYDTDKQVQIKYLQLVVRLPLPLPESVENDIIEIYRNLYKDIQYRTTSMIGLYIQALCLTREWKEALKLLEHIGGCSASVGWSKCIILAATKHGYPDISLQELNETYSENHTNSMDCVKFHKKYTQYASEQNKELHKEFILNMFKTWRKHNIFPSTTVFASYLENCKALGWEIAGINVGEQGTCGKCKGELQKYELTRAQYEELEDAVVHQLCLFQTQKFPTIPRDIAAFRKFVAVAQHCDIVIDGLNILYKAQHEKMSYHDKFGCLQLLVKYFVQKGYSVFVIGRQHMMKISTFRQLKELATVYLVKDNVPDDPFTLYATLGFGPNTKFVSRDLMREHAAQLPSPNLRKLFQIWQLSRQYILDDGTWQVRHPLEHQPCSRSENGHWHIGCSNTDVGDHAFDFVPRWYCLKPQ